MSKLNVAVLMGGKSTEREISLWTGKQIVEALDPAKYVVSSFDTGKGLPFTGGETLPDVVVIALHGPGGEDGTIQGYLELLGVPYTGSKVLASALAMDKAMTKRILRAGSVRTPGDITLTGPSDPKRRSLNSLELPVVVKPNTQGSTIGMTIVKNEADIEQALDAAFEHDQIVIVEEFISGTEITVPIIGNDTLEILPIVEIVPKSGFYDYQSKYTAGATEEICPARLSPEIAAEVRHLAKLSHELLGCRGMSRTDMIVDKAGLPWVLEVNTIPGMTPLSLLPCSASTAGYSFAELLDRLIDLAVEDR